MSVDLANSEKVLFLKRFISSPAVIGSIIPSSSFLTRKMIRCEELKTCKSIIELGAGTGVFTCELFDKKPKDCSFYVFEKDMKLKQLLSCKFPNACFFDEAADIMHLYKTGKIERPDLIISGIPFAVLEPSLRKGILHGVYEILPEGGKFFTFQYSLNLYKDLKALFKNVALDFELKNIPPAFIYRCTK